MLIASHNVVLRRLDKNVAVWQLSWRHFQLNTFPCLSGMSVCQKCTLNGKLPVAFSLNSCYHYPTEWDCFLEDSFSQYFAFIRAKKKRIKKITYLFSQEGRITFNTLIMRAAPITPTTTTSMKLNKIGKDWNQNLHNLFLKSSTHWHITCKTGKNTKIAKQSNCLGFGAFLATGKSHYMVIILLELIYS